ncbi:energy transducer TonB [Myxococcota bacterium]|nr:energy transducer TonB [Myxococcota bacterium]
MRRSLFPFFRQIGALAAMCLGGFSILGLMVAMNVDQAPKKTASSQKAQHFDLQPPRRRPPKRSTPRTRPRPRPATPTPRAPMPQLAAHLSGFSFGIPGLTHTGIEEASNRLLGQTTDASKLVMTEDAVDTPPQAIHRVAAAYPPRARARNLTGHVRLRLLIDAHGNVQEAEVIEAQPTGVFEQSALTAIRQWRFSPALYKGKAVQLRATQTIQFTLE